MPIVYIRLAPPTADASAGPASFPNPLTSHIWSAKVAQGDPARCVAEVLLLDLLPLRAPKHGRNESFYGSSTTAAVGVVLVAAVSAAADTLDEAGRLLVEPVVRLYVEEDLRGISPR